METVVKTAAQAATVVAVVLGTLVALSALGTYDVVVYPHRTTTGSFDSAQAVRLTVR